MSVIAVSGASGFVGRHLCAELGARGHRVVGLSRHELVSKDLPRVLEGADCVVHLAARAHVLHETGADPVAEFRKSNVELTQAVARAAMSAGIPRLVFMSSAGVLGAASPPDGFHDGSIPSPHDPYTASKLEAEGWLGAELEAQFRLAIVRPPLIYGAGAKGNLMRLLRLALSGWPLPLGSLRAPRSMIGVRNVVDLLALTAVDPRLTRATLLTADRETLSVAELYGAVARHAGHRPWLAPLPPALVIALLTLTGRARDVARLTAPFVLKPTEAYRRFGWLPPHSLGDELRTTVEQELAVRARVKK